MKGSVCVCVCEGQSMVQWECVCVCVCEGQSMVQCVCVWVNER